MSNLKAGNGAAQENAPGWLIGRRNRRQVESTIPRVAIEIHATGAFFTLVLKDLCSQIAAGVKIRGWKGVLWV